MTKIIQIILILLIGISARAQDKGPGSVRIMFLNADGFYNTVDDPGAEDDDFIQGGSLGWDRQKYSERSSNIAGIIAGTGNDDLPGIVVISGIENRVVAEDILSDRALKKGKYDILADGFYPGSGIVVAAMEGVVKIESNKIITPDLNPAIAEMSVILYVKARLADGNIYHIFLNEWPSRVRSGSAGNSMRMLCAAAVRKEVDNIINFETDARIVVMGSFYEEPTSGGIMSVLNATNKRKNFTNRDLYNLHYDLNNNDNLGTTMVNGTWQMYDFIAVSSALLRGSNNYPERFEIGGIRKQSESFGSAYRGMEYTGHSGNHLPVFIDIKLDLPE
ncbi:MAG: hypothetical protein R2744_02115 [Bacteroidales bacterium]